MSITPPVSSIPVTQHQKRRHDYFKIGFAYCQWGAGSTLPLWRPVCLSSLPEFSDNKQWPHGHVHWSFCSWWIVKIEGQSMGSYLSLNSWGNHNTYRESKDGDSQPSTMSQLKLYV
ncbi:hypothetical protein TNCV_20341 [Trichonephila clavipes]|nr:hypothetical protein TNCV_20341 [Trichonephila clavipes]